MPATAQVTLAILAGGESSRMGRPKSHLQINGTPILAWMLDRFRWPGPTMLVVSPEHDNPPGFERFSAQVCDPVAEQGPLRGVLTALENLTTPLVAIATVDMPGIDRLQLDWLCSAIQDSQAVMMSHPDGGRTQTEPFPSIWRATAIDLVQSQFRKGDPSVKVIGRLQGGRVIPAPHDWPASVWRNINTPEDFESFLAGRRA